jgi:hypothetical protein
MAALPEKSCLTLEAADAALEAGQDRRRRAYLGMSAIGNPCERALWYGFRWVALPAFDATTIKRFEDGHASEAVAIARLKAVPGIELHDTDEAGEQFGFKDLGGHFSGHMDGVALGLRQAPKTWHVVEIKASEKWQDLDKAKRKVGEKHALAEWNPVYYAQAVLYMDYAGIDRHYLVCTSPGARRWTAVRTNADPAFALILKAKAERIIFSDHAPQRIGGPDNFGCKWCDWRGICHEGAAPERNCRTCLHSEPLRAPNAFTGQTEWRCVHFAIGLSRADQERGGECPLHRFLPDLVPGDQIDATPQGITYRMADGSTWIDRGCGEP